MSLHPRCAIWLFGVLALAAPGATHAYQVRAGAGVVVGSTICDHQDGGAFPAVHEDTQCQVEGVGAGSSMAHADLRSGSLGVHYFALPGEGTVTSGAYSSLTDILTFSVPGGIGSGENLLIGVTFTINGTVQPGTSMSLGSDSYLDYTLAFTDLNDFSADHALDVRDSIATAGTQPFVFAKTVKVRGPLPRVEVLMDLVGGGISDGDVDFDPVTIELDLPPGVTFASESGAFLAPEPDATALAVAGAAVLGVLSQRRPRATALRS